MPPESSFPILPPSIKRTRSHLGLFGLHGCNNQTLSMGASSGCLYSRRTCLFCRLVKRPWPWTCGKIYPTINLSIPGSQTPLLHLAVHLYHPRNPCSSLTCRLHWLYCPYSPSRHLEKTYHRHCQALPSWTSIAADATSRSFDSRSSTPVNWILLLVVSRH